MRAVRTPRKSSFACLLVALAALTGCSGTHHEGDPFREGLAEPLDGMTYDVFITRQLNTRDVEDRGYVSDDFPGAPPGSAYYGVFLEACNISEEPLRSASTFQVVDALDNEFSPLELEPGNPFAYEAEVVAPGECMPDEGSVASGGPTGGVLLIFEVPLESSENRPLELEIVGDLDFAEGEPAELVIELDI